MPLKRDPSKALQIGFLVVLGVASAQVAWWIGENVHYSRDVAERLERLYLNSAEALAAARGGALAETDNALLRDLVVDGEDVAVDARTLDELRRQAEHRVRRYYWEGGFFLAVLIGGMSVLTAAIRHDYAMRRRQQNFLAGISHEFKSPLTSIRLAAETLARRADGEDTRRYVPRILADTDRLLTTVDNLLDTVRLEEGRARLAPRVVTVASAVDAVVEEMLERAAVHGIALERAVDAEARVTSDPDALETMLRNLVDNAIKACVAGGGTRIGIRVECVAGRVEIAVSDDGMGFPPDDGKLLFEKFYRVGDEMQRATPGSGLGLYIVSRLAQRCGAEVRAHSDGPGKGATVSISLARAESAP